MKCEYCGKEITAKELFRVVEDKTVHADCEKDYLDWLSMTKNMTNGDIERLIRGELGESTTFRQD